MVQAVPIECLVKEDLFVFFFFEGLLTSVFLFSFFVKVC